MGLGAGGQLGAQAVMWVGREGGAGEGDRRIRDGTSGRQSNTNDSRHGPRHAAGPAPRAPAAPSRPSPNPPASRRGVGGARGRWTPSGPGGQRTRSLTHL